MWNGCAIERLTTERSAGRGGRYLVGCLLALAALAEQPASAEPPGSPESNARDPRIFLVEKQAENNWSEALAAIERALAEDPAGARELGLEYLYGHLLSRVGREQQALEAFAATLGSKLGAFSRYRLAAAQEARGHPEIAAGLVATLLGSSPPRSLVVPAMELLERTVAAGGDCRLLPGLENQRWNRDERRRLTLASAGCAARGGNFARAEILYRRLLEEERGDEVARTAVERLLAGPRQAGRPDDVWDARTHLLLGLTFYNHREFRPAVHHLARALVRSAAAGDISSREDFECRYALARSHFWLGRYDAAATTFEAIAKASPSVSQKAQALYQQGRALELLGDWHGAADVFEQAYRSDPRNRRWADAALISRMRLQWLLGERPAALATYERLVAHRKLATASRALLFLATSELARPDATGDGGQQAEAWLAAARQLGKTEEPELRYWQGRLDERRGRLAAAAENYVQAMLPDPFHPFGMFARHRLAEPPLLPSARRLGRQLALSDRVDELYAASLLLGPADPRSGRVRRSLEASLTADRATAPYLRLTFEPAESWPLWQAPLKRPEEMLLALGLFGEASPVVLRHFPVAVPDLAFTGSLVLSRSGATRQSLYIAEILAERIPSRVPTQVLSPAYRRLLFPWSYGRLIAAEAGERGVDPFLLAAIIREESRFDPRAFSSASARGLTQFVYPTARRIADRIGLAAITPRDLEHPETAIALGAAYLEELLAEFDRVVPTVVAAYNAGEPQADLWRRFCVGDEPDEYLTKISFAQTRAYVTKVLTSREHYADLYPAELAASGD